MLRYIYLQLLQIGRYQKVLPDNHQHLLLWLMHQYCCLQKNREYKLSKKEKLDLILDTKEKEYIKKYNSYGNNGYNQTLGGDKGVDGYKFTDEQRIKHVEASIKVQNDGRNKIYAYDLDTKCTYMTISLAHLNKILNTRFNTGDVRNLVIKNKYLLARSIEDLEIKKEKYNNLNSVTRKFGKF